MRQPAEFHVASPMAAFHDWRIVTEKANIPVLRGLRVLHIQKAKGIGGSERHILDLCSGLQTLGARPHVLWLEQKGHSLDGLLALGRERGMNAERFPILEPIDLTLAIRLRQRFLAEPPDLVHVHLIHATLHGVLAARWAGIGAIVATRHGDQAYQKLPWFKLAARAADRGCTFVLAPSRWLADHTAHYDQTPRHKIRVVRHGIDLKLFGVSGSQRERLRVQARRSWGAAPEDVVVGSTARLHPSKDHATLLEAFSILVRQVPHCVLVLLGTGPLEAELRSSARALLPHGTRVHFLGERPDVEGLLPGFDILVNATLQEGFCLAALEGMAAGLPVVATRVGPLPELIEDGRAGYLVPPRDPESMAATLLKLSRDPHLRSELGRQAAMLANKYTQDRMVNETAAIYADALTSSAARV